MNKLGMVVLFAGIAGNCFGMDNDKVCEAAKKFVELKDYYENKVSDISGKATVKITSFFDFSKNNKPLKKAFTPDVHGNYDIRSLEMALCRFSQASQPLLKKQRGSIGFGLGILVGAAVVKYSSKNPKRTE